MSTYSYDITYFYSWELSACLCDITCFESCGVVPALMYVKCYCIYFIGIDTNLFVSSNTYEENFIITSTAYINPLNAELNPICHLLALLGAHHIFHVSRIRVNIYPQNHNTHGKPTIKGKLVLQLKKLQHVANFIMQIHYNELNPFWSYFGPRPTVWFSSSAPMLEDVRHGFCCVCLPTVGARPTLFPM